MAERGYRSLSAHDDTVCALNERGAVRCWGGDGWGETRAPEGSFTQIAPGENHVCALGANRRLRCWGSYAGTPL